MREQRIGQRIPARLQVVDWEPLVPTPRRFRRRRATHSAEIVELSITGAGFRVASEPVLEVGEQVTIRAGDLCGVVEIRHIEHEPDPPMVRYGAAFIILDAPLFDLVGECVSSGRSHNDWKWDLRR